VVKAMRSTTPALFCCLLPLASACAYEERSPAEPLDCSVGDAYEFLNISNFSGGDSGWFRYADPTPGGVPDLTVEDSNVPITEADPPGRCGDTRMIKLEMRGHNFWGAGFGDWAHNEAASRANGTGYEGISFWARSARDSEKTFFLNVDDGRTIVLTPDPPDATAADQDLDGDGIVGPGDIARGTQCRLPPPQELGAVSCYSGGVGAPTTAGVRVPVPGECGNSFHTRVTTTWQLFLIPWNELVQWPCPNRLEGGIDPADIAKFEIKFVQGTSYELWLDEIAFYRARRDGS
jgi:hypothetical protein